jgi:hypothetical protein
MGWIGRGSMRATLHGRPQRREHCDFLNHLRTTLITTARESDLVSRVSEIAPRLPTDIEALQALVAAAYAERDVAIAERDQALSHIDRLRHLLRQLQRAQFGRRSEKIPSNCFWRLRTSSKPLSATKLPTTRRTQWPQGRGLKSAVPIAARFPPICRAWM